MKATITTTKVVQSANELLGKTENQLFYLIIETEKGKKIINIGEKTFNDINSLNDEKTDKKTR